MNTKNYYVMIVALLAVVLATALTSLPAAAGDLGPAGKLQAFSRTIGPFIPGDTIGPDEGKPDSKKPGVYQNPDKKEVALSFKLGLMIRRIKLIQPVWIPGLTAFTKPDAGE